ncbi:uncharacterized protein LOC132723981 isoform X2 [Ruditapes philippinarum]|uniref:uncharacterized protein LOC132723981 isoform X2 n=1 Tax=Ruditapes philippinarum TaxID=129788 RepID=UPI00295C1FF4|nr:uncharacterized protein LOC132723981 isoform X2 [Ruditapes philippinarum]
MAETEATTEILSTSAVRKYFDIKHCGNLHVEKKKWAFFSKTKWDQKYFMISKGAKYSCKWNFFCFENTFASKQEWSIQMSDMESVREYGNKSDKDFVGIRIIFITHRPEMILRCDTEQNREVWIINIREAIQEAHSDSVDSGFESGGSIARRCITRDSRRSNRQSNKYHTIDEIESDIEDDNITEGEKQSPVDIASETKGSDIFKKSDETSGIKKKTRHYENVLPDGNIRFNIQDDNDKRNGEGREISSDTLSVPIQVDDDMAGLEFNTMEETYAKEIEPSNTQEAEGAVIMRSLAQSASFASIKSDQGESVENSFSMVSIRSHESQKRNLNDNGSCLKKGQCRDSSSSSGSSGSESTPIDTPARLTENFEENDYIYTENHFDKNIMNGVPIGTFLVQMRTKSMGFRLHVMTPKGVMCFKIYEQDGQLSLYKQFNVSSAVFGSLKAFLKHYNVHWLPKEEYKVRLTRGYKARQTADLL